MRAREGLRLLGARYMRGRTAGVYRGGPPLVWSPPAFFFFFLPSVCPGVQSRGYQRAQQGPRPAIPPCNRTLRYCHRPTPPPKRRRRAGTRPCATDASRDPPRPRRRASSVPRTEPLPPTACPSAHCVATAISPCRSATRSALSVFASVDLAGRAAGARRSADGAVGEYGTGGGVGRE